ncbi:MAG: PCMD domain-containing protein [Marinifilaceae bacterium]|nr:PCMD domain-containing protein [Marinifilaceae bacterium]
MKYIKFYVVLAFAFLVSNTYSFAQKDTLNQANRTIEPLKYGHFDNWMVHQVEESGIIGGNTKYTYEAIASDTLKDNKPFKPNGATPWANSSVMAHVKGIYKASTTIFPEERDGGFCARMETRIENVKVLGFINLNVLATGTIYTGETLEPIKSADNPQSKISRGIPFTKRPTGLIFDYKVKVGGVQYRTGATGFGKPKNMGTQNRAEVYAILQHRWEEDGEIYAARVGTGFKAFEQDVEEWQNNYEIPIKYGDISKDADFDKAADLNDRYETEECFYALNSEGENVPIHEIKWDGTKEPTHLILIFTSGNGGAYIGAPDAVFWIDNVKLAY